MTSLDVVKRDGGEDDDGDESAAVDPAVVEAETPVEILGAPAASVPMAVDPPQGHVSALQIFGFDLTQRKAVVPEWMKSREKAKQIGLWTLRFVGFQITYHVTRSPKYLVKGLWQEVRGTWKVVTLYVAWLLDLETRGVMRDAKKGGTKEDRDRYDSLKRLWTKTVHQRVLISFGWVAAGAVIFGLAVAFAPVWFAALVAAGVVGGLGWLGRNEEKPLFDHAVSTGNQPFKLNSKMIVQALAALGIANINAAVKADPKDAIRFPAPIREDGPGWKATIDLPHGVTAAHIMEKRSELASGLRRPLGCVWPESVPEVHAGRLVLWVGHRELSAMKPPAAPYLREGWRCDAFGLIPFGFDQRGHLVEFDLMYGNMLIGALPGAGKTAATRGLLLALSLDITVQFRISEHKGSGDLSMFEQMAHFYVSGVTDEDIAMTVQMLRDVLNEIERRAKVVKNNSHLAPESKVTRQAANLRHLGLWPIVVVVDEAQELFTHDEYGKEAKKLAERGIKRGRAFGVIYIFATQRPDRDSIPTGVTANVSHRFCLRVMGQIENDLILGVSSYKQGIQATTLSPRDKGVGYLKGAFDDAIIVRAHYQDKPLAETIAKRAFNLRKKAGTITGMAAGEEPEKPPSFNLLDDIATIFTASVRMDRAHSETLCEQLRELRPEVYADWSPNTLASALPEGLTTTQVSVDGWNRRGLRKRDVLAAIERRDTPELGPGGFP